MATSCRERDIVNILANTLLASFLLKWLVTSLSRKIVVAYMGLLLGCPLEDKQDPTVEPDTDPGTTSDDTGDAPTTGAGATEPGTGTTDPGTGTTEPDTGTDTGSQTGSDTGLDDSGEDTGEDTGGDTEDVPQECQLAEKDITPFVTGDLWDVDEICVVLASAIMNDTLELTLDCPIVALSNGGLPVTFQVANVPLPAAPQVGDSLDVLYQSGDFEGYLNTARPELLFLGRDGALLHAVIHGYFLTDEDLARVDTHALPLSAALVAGPCPHVATGWDGIGDGVACQFEAVSQIELAGDAELLLSPGQVGEITAGGHTYVADLREALHRMACVEMDENIYYTLAIARK